MKLKPCPFCGNAGHLEGGESALYDNSPFYYVVCWDCGASTAGNRSKHVAIDAWNHRISEKRRVDDG